MTGSGADKSKIVRRAIIGGLGAAAGIMIVTLSFQSLGSVPAAPSVQSSPRGRAEPSTQAVSPANSIPTPSPTTDPGDAALGPSPKETAPRTSTEVEKGPTAEAALPAAGALPVLFSGPLPKSASAAGKLVVGFPAVIPLAQGSKIADSSVSSSANILQATFTAKTSLSRAAVIAFYQSEFAKVSLPGSPLPAVGGSTAFDFARDGNSITLTVAPSSSGGSIYSLLGVLRASS
jgi:hypothetical protein